MSDESPPRRVRVRVPAKVNLHLGVGPLRPDGFHDVAIVFQAISLYDELTAERLPAELPDATGPAPILTIEGEGAGQLPTDHTNLVVRAANVLADHAGVAPAVRLHLRKQIPVAGGMAGGSADAAAALVACDALWGLATPRDQLAELAATLGSDVPFLLLGGEAVGTGRGEELTPLPAGPTRHWVMAAMDDGLSAGAVYAELDRLRASGTVPAGAEATPASGATSSVPHPTDAMVAALANPDPAALSAVLTNDLQPAALSLMPTLGAVLEAGRAAGALGTLVSGSGPTCLFLAADAGHATALAATLRSAGLARTVQTAHGPVPGATVVDPVVG